MKGIGSNEANYTQMELEQIRKQFSEEVVELLRSDWESGLTKAQTDIYLKSYYKL